MRWAPRWSSSRPARSSRSTTWSAVGHSAFSLDNGPTTRRWLERHDERQYFYVDATSFEMMRRERITEALASDGDFSAAGFIEVRP